MDSDSSCLLLLNGIFRKTAVAIVRKAYFFSLEKNKIDFCSTGVAAPSHQLIRAALIFFPSVPEITPQNGRFQLSAL